jgi:hypothetical protein
MNTMLHQQPGLQLMNAADLKAFAGLKSFTVREKLLHLLLELGNEEARVEEDHRKKSVTHGEGGV